MSVATTVTTGLRRSNWLTRERVRAYAVIVLAVEVVALLLLAARTYDLILPIDPPTSLDFMSFYAAGDLTDHGTPALAYNEAAHEHAEKQIYGDPRIPYFGFYYPPVYELLCAVLATVPFTASYLLFILITGAAYFWVLRGTVRDPVLIAAVAAFPAAFLTVALGQNSFLTTALMGGALLLLDRRPALAGVLFGAMCYKPHFLLLVPVALIAGRYWITILTAAVTGIALTLLSLAVFGWHTWYAFLATTLLTQSVFETGRVGFYHLVSVFGAVRLVGGGTSLAMSVQGGAILGAAAAVAVVWYRRADMAVRAATLIAATLVALPVILFYDLLPATIAMAWLMRDARRHGYFSWEKTLLCAMYPIALLCRGIGEKTHVPIGWLLTFGLLGIALAHYRRDLFAEQIADKA
jgi:hypothetical protein